MLPVTDTIKPKCELRAHPAQQLGSKGRKTATLLKLSANSHSIKNPIDILARVPLDAIALPGGIKCSCRINAA